MADAPAVARQYENTPEGRAQRWTAEFGAARKDAKTWHERAEKIVRRFIDDRTAKDDGSTRLNLFSADTRTMLALLYGKTPQVDVARRFADNEDDVARVASEMLERLLNTDIERDSDTASEAFRQALEDHLVPGLGSVRLRFTADFDGDDMSGEEVEVVYEYWQNQLWSPCRVFAHMRWWAFKAEMSYDAFCKRFGEEKSQLFASNKPKETGNGEAMQVRDPTDRCEVWEIWSKELKSVDWYVDGQREVLDTKPDPLGLDGFWPFPRPMVANPTTSRFMPTPFFYLVQDLYDEIDTVSTRITLIEQCVRVAGLYDKNEDSIKRLVSDTAANEMIGVDSWSAFASKGGVEGAVDWLPLDQMMKALDVLRGYRTELIALKDQITGMSDIMRGQASGPATATEQAIKARFASVRVQSAQDEFARFCSDVQKIKAEIISKHFSPQTIIDRSNILRTPDAQFATQAVQLIKSDFYQYRISVNPDSVSLTDFAALKQERMEWAQTIAGLAQAFMPIGQAMPGSMPFLLQIMQEVGAGLKGGSTLEAIFDQAVAQAKAAAGQPKPPAPPDPKLQAAQVKAGAEQFKAKADMMGTAMDLKVAQAKHGMDMQKLEAQQRADGLKALASIGGPQAAPP